MSVVGARPQFVKLAPIAHAAAAAGVEHFVVHTGQHYDERMSESFFDELQIPTPDINLGVGSASHAAQTGRMLADLEPVMQDVRPDWVLAYGDTNSTLATAVCAVKIHIPLAHLEAGLRSFNRGMPEEHNRVLTDHSADLCLAPTWNAMGHLRDEGLAARSVLVGDVMTDVLLATAESLRDSPSGSPIPPTGDYIIATIHRPANTDDPMRLRAIVEALAASPVRVYLAAHPRLVAKSAHHRIELAVGAITTVPPLSYRQLVQAVTAARHVVTDSGGLQKEAFLLGVPTTTVRPETEWVETLEHSWNELVNDPSRLLASVERPRPTAARGKPYGEGHAAAMVIETLIQAFRSKL
ncbi:non-hydrolyzing UDP-N-acetylglucosamine 2-epimerase [Cumulibacter manganitolerans]|uniref:non-hydrolyzing UDP-N-acetylglucosamine 2-epimerase n=1 Tax=Cumulibacter manganitolerans TaxID=1884992 RepID=UPI001E449AC4|nr:UDP-N-acetylglucosamine 2-epimerase (non-hydrolyzing) [Cumulibacter manganitolerans]